METLAAFSPIYRVYMLVDDSELYVVDVDQIEDVTKCVETCVENNAPCAVFRQTLGDEWIHTPYGHLIDKATNAIGMLPTEYKSFIEEDSE